MEHDLGKIRNENVIAIVSNTFRHATVGFGFFWALPSAYLERKKDQKSISLLSFEINSLTFFVWFRFGDHYFSGRGYHSQRNSGDVPLFEILIEKSI